jgi:beta-galactosidase
MLSLSLPTPPAPPPASYALGAATSPAGITLGVDPLSLLRDGRRWLPVMGELHFTRVPPDQWLPALRRLRAGGISIVSTYIFWIHHEESPGESDWRAGRDLRRFVQLAAAADLLVAVRIGPWCHGEVRHGGLPDWVVAACGQRARTDDPAYLAAVSRHYVALAAQLAGLLWRDGGPVVACQLDNEYSGPAEHLLTLKNLARAAGIDVPYYTRTGWPDLATPMPLGELLPLYGAYAEGFWDRALTAMPGFYPPSFRFSPLRTDAAIATDLLGQRAAADPPDTGRYPFLTCELGGGMMSSYHRRLDIAPHDIAALALTKLGSGGNLPGYYMYHGGTNPDGRLSTLQETQATGYWNDLPEKNYDFQAPVGAAGQLRPHYHALRRLHLLAHAHGEVLAGLPAHFPAHPTRPADDDLRWAVRSDGRRGFVFINNHERGRELPPRRGVQFTFTRADGFDLTLPRQALTLPPGASLVWPFGLELAPGLTLDHITAWPLGHLDDEHGRTVFFGATEGVPVEVAPVGEPAQIVPPGRGVALERRDTHGRAVRLVVLAESDTLALWRLPWRGRERLFLTPAGLVSDGLTVTLTSECVADHRLAVFPPLPDEVADDGVFQTLALPAFDQTPPPPVTCTARRAAGPPRVISMGWTTPPVAIAPTPDDFAAAAVWELHLPVELDPNATPRLRLRYIGDVARVSLGGRLLLDDFFNGQPLELDLSPHHAALRTGASLTVEILPQTPDMPILWPESAQPPSDSPPRATLHRAELVRVHSVVFP